MTSSRAETLKEEINAQRRSIAALPPCRNRTEQVSKVKQQQILADKVEEYELLLESQRVDSVVRGHEELHPPVTDECPICLETIRIASVVDSWSYFLCCGNGMCRDCHKVAAAAPENEDERISLNDSCPLCRATLPDQDEGSINFIKKHADNGRAWAQCWIGKVHMDGLEGFTVDIKEGLKWLELAAEQHDPQALYQLGEHHGIAQSFSRAKPYFQEAADLGHISAQVQLGSMYLDGIAGAKDESKAAHYSTLAYSSRRDPLSALNLGRIFLKGYGNAPHKSLVRAKHYLQSAAEKGMKMAYILLAQTLLNLYAECFDSIVIPGHSCIPSVLFWARKAAETGDSDVINDVEELERLVGQFQFCANCKIPAEDFSGKLKLCVRCKAFWYCGRECQLKHW
eukprot:CAMPEP_0172319826 /NCGR_PEP_ID=MMETSP1058-20130122/38809_1 /TAXON_ID=83371 /ORGANISM="Detonula confervacea, Strain CCMP 353" /LENGTH=397 /DNA_ID=CAMNT_0013034957 /DNA_START=41 /DNA_END=1231 /DNA_ORIENTATION=+